MFVTFFFFYARVALVISCPDHTPIQVSGDLYNSILRISLSDRNCQLKSVT